MRTLIVGAGSVGQLYGYSFQRGGAQVDVYVRPKYADEAREGFTLYERKRGLQSPQRFLADEVLTAPQEIASRRYDAVVLAIPSDGLRGDWFAGFAASIGESTLVSLSPSLEDRNYIEGFLPSDQIVNGLITSVSYPAPLPGESVEKPGTAYWFAPMTPAFFQGERDRMIPLIEVLNRGGMTARAVPDLASRAAFASAVLMPAVATLESVGWSFKALRKNREARRRLANAAEETLSTCELIFEKKRPLPMRMISPLTIAGGLIFAPALPPFDLEEYIELHFTKVAAQTEIFFQDYIQRRAKLDLDSPAIEALLAAAKTGSTD